MNANNLEDHNYYGKLSAESILDSALFIRRYGYER